MKWNRKFLWTSFLVAMVAQVAASDCNTSAPLSCVVDSNCPISGTVYASTWYFSCGTAFCSVPDCHWHQPTYGCHQSYTYNGTCAFPGLCGGSNFIDSSACSSCGSEADCVNTVAFCTTGACTAFTPWLNVGCAANGCGVGKMSQIRDGLAPLCCGPSPQYQCIPDVSCAPPVIVTFTANPLVVRLGDPLALSWTLSGGIPTSQTIDQGIGAVVGTSTTTTPGALGPLTYTLTVTNAMGSSTATAIISVIPPQPRCGIGKICGIMSAKEKPSLALAGQVIRLYDGLGHHIQTTNTDALGGYSFNGLAAGAYTIYPGNGKVETSSPSQVSRQPNAVIGSQDFQKRGVPAQVVVEGPVGSMVIITTFSFTEDGPPVTGPGLGDSYPMVWSKTIDKVFPPTALALPGGQTYWFKCWTPVPLGFSPSASHAMNGGATLWPLDSISEVCP